MTILIQEFESILIMIKHKFKLMTLQLIDLRSNRVQKILTRN